MIGLIDEWDLLLAVQDDPGKFRQPVRSAMTQRLETVRLKTPLASLMDTFHKGYVAIVVDQGRFGGLITRIDVSTTCGTKRHDG